MVGMIYQRRTQGSVSLRLVSARQALLYGLSTLLSALL